MTFITSCFDETRNRLPSINPGQIELSATRPEAYFQVSPRDYDMFSFRIDDQEYRITKELRKREIAVIHLSDGYKATLYCKKSRLNKIDLGFMTIEKMKKGLYKVQLVKNIDIKTPAGIDFGFISSDGISIAVITFEKQTL